ncbi:hypothetical protein [Pleionea sediminis]|uniref:hypothetical protein n=1 Tax=Pleionea sediminis TaxID=2569479 RepID=UPI0011850A56|nr:hypothetical protein [Pleionea sediminis]
MVEEIQGEYILSSIESPSFGWTLLLEYDLDFVREQLNKNSQSAPVIINDDLLYSIARVGLTRGGASSQHRAVEWLVQLDRHLLDDNVITALKEFSENKKIVRALDTYHIS